MIEARPTFILPPCPVCSGRGIGERGLVRPTWKYAHLTSAKRKHGCYFFVGCHHADAVSKLTTLVDEPAEWARIEAAWQAKTLELFATQTARWTDAQREDWKKALDARAFLPGAVAPLPGMEDAPSPRKIDPRDAEPDF